MAKLLEETEHPLNSIENNYKTWNFYDWSQAGDEWNPDDAWKDGFVAHVLIPQIPSGARALEIGPGGGRWTEYLIQRCSHVTAVDLSDNCIALCKQRFKDAENLELHVNDGKDLSFLPAGSFDRIWSFDVFVHILKRDVADYVRQFAELLAPGGRAIIHHARYGENAPKETRDFAWRSDMTAEAMCEFAAQNGLNVVTQFDRYDDGRQGIWVGLDIISVLEKP